MILTSGIFGEASSLISPDGLSPSIADECMCGASEGKPATRGARPHQIVVMAARISALMP
jgi:hypothetical protein